MKKQTFIKSVHKALRDANIVRGNKREWFDIAGNFDPVRYESYINPRELYMEVVSARNSSMSRQDTHCRKVIDSLSEAGIKFTYPQGIWVFVNFKDNGVED